MKINDHKQTDRFTDGHGFMIEYILLIPLVNASATSPLGVGLWLRVAVVIKGGGRGGHE